MPLTTQRGSSARDMPPPSTTARRAWTMILGGNYLASTTIANEDELEGRRLLRGGHDA